MFRQSQSHLNEVNESYFEHAFFASQQGLKLIGLGLIAILHGFVPGVFKTYVSDSIVKMNDKIQKRSKE